MKKIGKLILSVVPKDRCLVFGVVLETESPAGYSLPTPQSHTPNFPPKNTSSKFVMLVHMTLKN